MPKAGITVESCIIGEWQKKVGDTIKKGDILFTYERTRPRSSANPGRRELLEYSFRTGTKCPVL